MAIISGSIAAIATASKVLAGAMSKKAMMSGAKNFVKGKAKNAVKNRIGGKGKKKGRGGEGGGADGSGAIVRSGSSDIAPTSPMLGGALPDPAQPKVQRVKPVGKVSFASIGNQLDSIVSLAASIESVTGKGIVTKKKKSAAARKNKEKAKNRAKENRLEGIKSGVGKSLLNQGKKASEGLGITNFFTKLFLGFVALTLLKFARPIMAGIEFATKNLHLTFLAFKGLNETFKLIGPKVSKFFKNSLNKFKGFKPNIWGKIGKGVKATFKALSNIVPGFITKGIEKITNIAKAVGNAARAVGSTAKNVANTVGRTLSFNNRSSQLGNTSTALNRLTGSGGKGTRTLSTGLQSIRAKHGDEAARMFQGMVDNGVSPTRAARNVNKAIGAGKLTSAPMRGSLGGGMKGSQLLKGGASQSTRRALIKALGPDKAKMLLKKGGMLAMKSGQSRIPVIGPLIVAVTTYFEDLEGGGIDEDGNPIPDGKPDKKFDKALFKAGGALLGGFLGTFIPIPIVGTILGELVGEYVGELFYILMRGGGFGALGNKLKSDVTALFQTGQKVLGWAGDGFKRMYEGLPKFKLPNLGVANPLFYGSMNLLLGATTGKKIQDIEFPNPFGMTNVFDMVPMILKAFFSRDPMTPGEVKKSDDEPKGPRDTSSDKNQKIDRNYGLKPGQEVTFTTSTGMKVKAHKTTNGFDFYKEGFLGMGGDKIDFSDGKNSWIVDEFTQSQQSKNPDQPPGSTESSSTDQSGSSSMQADRPGSDTAGLKAVAPSSSQSATPYNASGGDKNRKIFLHWTAGGHNTPYSYYHTTFLGSGKAVRYTPYGKDKHSHTAGANTGSIGLSIAAMHGPNNQESASTWPTPPTSAQMDAMITEAAQIGLDWGWDASTVDKNVRTHGEWEREATSTGRLPGGPQRWDLDKLKPSDPNINVSRVLSHGGNIMRSRIKAKMASLKGGSDKEQKGEKGSPNPPPAAAKVSPVDKSEEMKKPERSDYTGRSGAANYEKALKKYEARKGTPVKAEVTPTETVTGQDVKPVDLPEMKKPERSNYTGRSGAADYEKDMKEYNSQQNEKPKITPTDTPNAIGQTPEPSTPTITPQKAPTQNIGGVEKQASYENPDEGSPSVVPLPPPQQPSGGGGGSKSSTSSIGSGNLLNSYYEAQFLGSLYKVG